MARCKLCGKEAGTYQGKENEYCRDCYLKNKNGTKESVPQNKQRTDSSNIAGIIKSGMESHMEVEKIKKYLSLYYEQVGG